MTKKAIPGDHPNRDELATVTLSYGRVSDQLPPEWTARASRPAWSDSEADGAVHTGATPFAALEGLVALHPDWFGAPSCWTPRGSSPPAVQVPWTLTTEDLEEPEPVVQAMTDSLRRNILADRLDELLLVLDNWSQFGVDHAQLLEEIGRELRAPWPTSADDPRVQSDLLTELRGLAYVLVSGSYETSDDTHADVAAIHRAVATLVERRKRIEKLEGYLGRVVAAYEDDLVTAGDQFQDARQQRDMFACHALTIAGVDDSVGTDSDLAAEVRRRLAFDVERYAPGVTAQDPATIGTPLTAEDFRLGLEAIPESYAGAAGDPQHRVPEGVRKLMAEAAALMQAKVDVDVVKADPDTATLDLEVSITKPTAIETLSKALIELTKARARIAELEAQLPDPKLQAEMRRARERFEAEPQLTKDGIELTPETCAHPTQQLSYDLQPDAYRCRLCGHVLTREELMERGDIG